MTSPYAANDGTPDSSADWMQLDRDALQYATKAYLSHLERLGLTHLPVASLTELAKRTLAQTVPVRSVIGPESTAAAPVSTAPNSAAPIHKPRPAGPETPIGTSASRSVMPSSESTGPSHYQLPVLQPSQRQQQLDAAQQQVASCVRCQQLASTRKNTVFGEGCLQPRVVFFGEAPGADEDRLGRPFVGRAGELLTKMIQACTFSREDCYILNTVKCRPPGNRNPQPEEVENCREFFELQLEVLQPEYIVCLGLVAARSLLRSELSVGLLRGRFHRYRTSKVVVTYHPSYLLRNPEAKKAAWEDLQFMLKDMGIDPRASRSG